MRLHSKLVLALITSAALIVPGTTASALNSIGVSATAFSSVAGSVTWSAGVIGTIRCSVTLRGTLNVRISKTANAIVGGITSGSTGSCMAGTMALTTTSMPWPIRYVGFRGTLPNITSVIVEINTFGVSLTHGLCGTSAYQGDIRSDFNDGGTANSITRFDVNNGVGGNSFSRLSGLCPTTMTMSGQWTLSSSRITLTLQ